MWALVLEVLKGVITLILLVVAYLWGMRAGATVPGPRRATPPRAEAVAERSRATAVVGRNR